MQLSDILNQIQHLSTVVNEHQRRLDNIIIPGKVKSLSEDNKLIKVAHGNCETPFIKWLAPAAGEVIEYRAPSIGEQCILLNLTGGADSSACIALFGMTSDKFDFVTPDPLEHIVAYPDGSKIRYNHSAKKLILDLAGEANINTVGKTVVNSQGNAEVHTQQKAIVTAAGNAEVTAPKILLNSTGSAIEEAVTLKTKCPFSGGPHLSCGNKVFIGAK